MTKERDGTEGLLISVLNAKRAVIKAERKARLRETIDQIPLEHREAWKLLPKSGKQDILVFLMGLGCNLTEAAAEAGVPQQTASDWFKNEPEHMHYLMNGCFSIEVLKDILPSLVALRWLRDFSPNEETRRKAARDLLSLSGHQVDGPHKTEINLNFQQNNVTAHMSFQDLKKSVLKQAEELGPEFVKHAQEVLGRGRPPGTQPA